MLVYSLLFVTLALAIYSLWLVRKAVRNHWTTVLLGIGIALFIYLYGTWVYLSIYAKWGFGIVFLLTFAVSLLQKKRSTRPVPGWKKGGNVFFSLLFLTLSVLYFTGTTGTPKTVNLAFPLKAGRYIVLQGGKGYPANVFHSSGRGTVYAMDIAKLNSWGNRAKHIFSKQLEDYEIFGDTVYAPCDGYVQRAISDNPDNIPPNRERGPHNLNGVVLVGKDCTIFLGHFKNESVFVKAGEVVKEGQPLGLAGNSGFSIEPHLHLQAHARGGDSSEWYRQPQLFIKFNEKEYLLFETINTDKDKVNLAQ